MNIFKILSSYDGNINEPNISAILAYFLNPIEDHGLGYELLNKIVLKLINENDSNEFLNEYKNNYYNYNVKVLPEFPVDVSHTSSKRNRRDIDILIEFYLREKDEKSPKFSICIENKILNSSINDKNQLNDEIEGLNGFYENSETKIFLILICPEYNEKINKMLNLIDDVPRSYLLWNNNEESIVKYISQIFQSDMDGKIDPLNTEIKYILKSFLSFINNDFKSEPATVKEEKSSYGKPVIEYLNDLYHKLDENENYDVKELRRLLTELIYKETGKQLHNTTRNCQIYMVTVNDLNRTNYGIRYPDDERKNLFYFIDEDKRQYIRKFNKNQKDDVNIYYLEDGERKSIKLSELIR